MNVAIIGVGLIAVGEHWDKGLRDLAAEAGGLALADADLAAVDALFVANAYSAAYNQQTQLGSLIADELGMSGIEAVTCEAGDAAGGAALRCASLAVASGQISSALVIGVEKATDLVGAERASASAISLDADYESVNGATLTAMAALLMRRYMYEYDIDLAAFEGFSVNAHRNGARNPRAMFRNQLRAGAFARAPMIADPISLFDSAPDGDGAAAVLLTGSGAASDLASKPVAIIASSGASDRFMLQDRADPLRLDAVARSFSRALHAAGAGAGRFDLMELHDAFTILTALSLEAMGLSRRGEGWAWARDGGARIARDGELPISAFGGLKARGHPGGATGVYQAAEAVLQLRGEAGANQVKDARTALIQNIGGLGSTVFTHILRAQEMPI